MNIIDLVAYKNESGLSRVKQGGYAYTYERLDRDVIRSTVGTFIIDLLRSSIQDKEVDLSLYAFVRHTLIGIDDGTISLSNLPIRFAIELAIYLGFQIGDNFSEDRPFFDLRSGQFVEELRTDKEVLSAEMSKELHLLMQQPEKHKLSKQYKQILLDKMMDYYRFHIEHFKPLRSIAVIRTILG